MAQQGGKRMQDRLGIPINTGTIPTSYKRPALRLWITSLFLILIAIAAGLGQQTIGTPGSPAATTTIHGRYVPLPQPFQGETGLKAQESKPAWLARVVPPKEASNILVGFYSALVSCFAGAT
jgi:hypothetical protein